MARMMKKLAWPLLLTSFVMVRQMPAQMSSDKVVEIDRINVTGTRCPANSIITLSGLKLHDKVKEIDVNAACHKVSATGLFKSIDYTYNAYPDRPGVDLNLAVVDEGPLIPASIKPAGEEAVIWTGLQAMDPIFARQMPPTEKAIAFYEKGIEKYLRANGRDDEYAAATVTGAAQGNPSGIIFEIRKYKSSPSKQ